MWLYRERLNWIKSLKLGEKVNTNGHVIGLFTIATVYNNGVDKSYKPPDSNGFDLNNGNSCHTKNLQKKHKTFVERAVHFFYKTAQQQYLGHFK